MATSQTEHEKSILLAEQEKDVQQPPYTDDEIKYLARLLSRIENAIVMREQEWKELDGMSYSDYYDENLKAANTFIEPRKNPEDSNFQSGTALDKMEALLSAINNLNLSPDVSAFNEDNIPVSALGEVMEDTILKTEELDGDEEKKMIRQRELLVQGHVFIEEIYDERWMMDKKVKGGGKFTGKIKGLSWMQRLKRSISKPSRNLLSGLTVFLGDMRQYYISEQPYIFTVDVKDYLEAEEMFGTWERWQYVPKVFQAPKIERQGTTYESAWKTINAENGQAVIIRYQDKWNNEFAVIINNVLMTPVGLPLTLVHGYADYNITQQNLAPIHSKFAIGNSFMRKIKGKVGILDEMLRLGVLKTQQSYKPPYFNFSGRVLSSKIFSPAKITQGIGDLEGKLVPVLQGQTLGITNSELAMIEKLQESINNSSVNPTFQGQRTGGDPTATEVVEMQRQAKLMLGLTISACSLLEWKVSWLRLYNILAKWFDPFDQMVEDIKGKLTMKNVFRRTAVERPVEGEGMGMRMVIPTQEELPSSQEVFSAEEEMKERTGKPVRMIFLKPEEIKNAKLIWQVVVRPREKITNELSKLLFRAELSDAQAFGPMVNLEFYAEQFARIWGRDPNKAFKKNIPPEPTAAAGVKVPGVPTPEQMVGLGKQVSRQ